MDNKLNFFQRQLKKYYLLRLGNGTHYDKLPEFLKKDEDILTRCFEIGQNSSPLQNNPAAIRMYINVQGLRKAYGYLRSEHIKYLTEEEQKNFLKEVYFKNQDVNFGKDISAFSDKVLIEAFNEYGENRNYRYPNIRILPVSCQKELIKQNINFKEKVSKDVLVEFVNNNPLLIEENKSYLPDELKIKKSGVIYNGRIFEEDDKFILDNYLVSKVGKDNLISFLKSFEAIDTTNEKQMEVPYKIKKMREFFIQFIEENYDERIKNIFIERPELINQDLKYIPTFSLFNPKIVEYFGLNMINQFLSYNDFGVEASIITRLANDEDFFENFKKYSVFSEEYYSNTPEDMYNKLKTFNNFYELFSSIDNYDKLVEDIKNSLFLAINDFEHLELELLTSHIKNIEDIKNYKEYRDRMLDEFIEKSADSIAVKDALFKRHFSMTGYSEGVNIYLDEIYNNANVSFRTLNLADLSNNQQLLDKLSINENIIETIELMNILRSIKDITVLRKLNKELASRENIINPFDISDLNKKIVHEYSEQLTNSLLTVENAKEKCNNGEDGISYREEDGFKIISLTGADFTICSHIVNLELNSGKSAVPNIDEWNTRESVSTLSTSIYTPYNVSHFLSKEFANNRRIIGFTDFSSSQVVGMGYGDIGASHDKRKLNPKFGTEKGNINFDSPTNLSIKNYIYDTGYSLEQQEFSEATRSYIERGYEVTLRRRKLDNSDPEKGTGGGKIQPSYIIVPIGQANEYYAEAKKWNVDTIIEVDIEAYKDVYKRMEDYGYKKQEERTVEKEKSDYIKEVQKMVGELNGQSGLQGKTK